MENELRVVRYESKYEEDWDKFVTKISINGTFLHSRRFLNYHPKGRFVDASWLMLDNKNRIIAVCAANEVYEENSKILFSHSGSTYGGIVISQQYCRADKLISIIRMFERAWIENDYRKVILKQTPGILSFNSIELFRYCYFYLGYINFEQPNLYVDLEDYSENILSEFSQGKRTNVNNCLKRGLYYKKINSYNNIKKLYDLLCISLGKYDVKPIHTIEEIYEFQNDRLKEECECFGVFEEDKMLAGSMMFYFNKANVAHTQYLCADPAYNKLSPMTFMYYVMILEARKRGFSKISWGICSENNGKIFNEGLAKSKENFGSIYDTNPIFSKELK